MRQGLMQHRQLSPPEDLPPSWLDHLDPRAKILGCLALILGTVAVPNGALWALLLCALPVSFLVGVGRLPWQLLARRYLSLLPVLATLTGLLLVAHILGGTRWAPGGLPVWVTAAAVGAKAFLAVSVVIVLVSRTPFAELMWGLQALRVPRLLLLVVASLHRWAGTLSSELARMRRSLVSRNYRPRWLGDAPTLGYLLGSFFLRTYTRSERIHRAMLSRGWEGAAPRVPPAPADRRLRAGDAVFVCATTCVGVLVALAAVIAR